MFNVDVKGEKTLQNLQTALTGEMMACMKYRWYPSFNA